MKNRKEIIYCTYYDKGDSTDLKEFLENESFLVDELIDIPQRNKDTINHNREDFELLIKHVEKYYRVKFKLYIESEGGHLYHYWKIKNINLLNE